MEAMWPSALTAERSERFPGLIYPLVQMLEKMAEKTDWARVNVKERAHRLLTNLFAGRAWA